MPRARNDLTLDDWPKAKALILQYLAEGWSLNIAYSRAGIDRWGRFRDCFQNDEEFKNLLKTYKHSRIGFHTVHDRLADKELSPQDDKGPTA